MKLYASFFKRILDFTAALILLVILLPFLLIIVIALKVTTKGVFFFQKRPGKHAKIFKVIKFKTMTDESGIDGELLPDEQRITTIGNFIRALSLDELPQLINVLKGDMSFIGPRPLMPKYLPLYSKEQADRHNVRPGITGWAQVNGRNNISWTKKFELDVWYIKNLSFILDIKIALLTVKKIVKKEGVSKDGFATTEAFNGKN
ncbi:MAG: sugar transferase [Bacteroidota bacterium]|nr:sugar transferase [Bacteroidota bacterium]